MKLFVLMLNDAVIGAYTTEELAKAAAKSHEATFFKRDGRFDNFYQAKYYHVREVELDAPAHF